ncbi:MAG: methylated-DNA--[protein]-cysteine S-methyltransferase [Alphaproteobacteria bacterium]|nr:methylated-DNA--[protein]-cysteine S-methyltransferase [Alphaproteobacteria bacterium]
MQTPVGTLSVIEINGKVCALNWADGDMSKEAEKQLDEYFNKQRKVFDFEYELNGTSFQKKVWKALLNIPYGTTKTYKDIAEEVGSHPRAIGGAVGANPIPIFIPCHRVVGSSGKMTGFSGGEGIPTKETLLKLEGVL